MKELYRKVVIKDESDLPKGDGIFICLWQPDTDREYNVLTWLKADDLRRIGLKEVEFYFLPVSHPAESKEPSVPESAEEIKEYADQYELSGDDIKTAIKNYVDGKKMPSDKDIQNAALEYSYEFGYSKKSAKEMIDAYKAGATELREGNIYISKGKGKTLQSTQI